MPEFLIDGDKIEFRPDAGWRWAVPFDGAIAARPTTERPMSILSKQVLVEEDLRALARQLEGKGYITEQHPAPGTVATAHVVIERTTLARPCQILGEAAAVRTTEGTFQVNCSPPASDPATGNTDSLLVKTGVWKVKSVQQSQAQCVSEQSQDNKLPVPRASTV
jgi:hypothetical protein